MEESRKNEKSGKLELCVVNQRKKYELRKKLFKGFNAFQFHVRVKRVQTGAFEHDKKDESFFVKQLELTKKKNIFINTLDCQKCMSTCSLFFFLENVHRNTYLTAMHSCIGVRDGGAGGTQCPPPPIFRAV